MQSVRLALSDLSATAGWPITDLKDITSLFPPMKNMYSLWLGSRLNPRYRPHCRYLNPLGTACLDAMAYTLSCSLMKGDYVDGLACPHR